MNIYICDNPKTPSKMQCDKCFNFFSKKGGNYKKHYDTCDGKYRSPEQRGNCPHCKQKIDLDVKNPSSVMANHVRWCKQNPKRNEYNKNNNGSQLNTKEARNKAIIKIKEAHKKGAYKESQDKRRGVPGKPHSQEVRDIISKKALENNYQRKCKKSHEYVDKHGRSFIFDSSWEDALAKRLDDLNIKWDRPEPIYYELEGKRKRYYPDFFLPDYNLYLDPKNSYVINEQKQKLDIVKDLIPLIIITSLKECKEWRPW